MWRLASPPASNGDPVERGAPGTGFVPGWHPGRLAPACVQAVELATAETTNTPTRGATMIQSGIRNSAMTVLLLPTSSSNFQDSKSGLRGPGTDADEARIIKSRIREERYTVWLRSP